MKASVTSHGGFHDASMFLLLRHDDYPQRKTHPTAGVGSGLIPIQIGEHPENLSVEPDQRDSQTQGNTPRHCRRATRTNQLIGGVEVLQEAHRGQDNTEKREPNR